MPNSTTTEKLQTYRNLILKPKIFRGWSRCRKSYWCMQKLSAGIRNFLKCFNLHFFRLVLQGLANFDILCSFLEARWEKFLCISWSWSSGYNTLLIIFHKDRYDHGFVHVRFECWNLKSGVDFLSSSHTTCTCKVFIVQWGRKQLHLPHLRFHW